MTANSTKGASTADLIREMMTGDEGQQFTASFLRGKFFLSAVDSLVNARKVARLTQAALARALGTKQPAIARMEQDSEGSMSLKRLYDYAAACDVIPLITLAPASQVTEFAREHPDEPLTADHYINWQMVKEQHSHSWAEYWTQSTPSINGAATVFKLSCRLYQEPATGSPDKWRHAATLATAQNVADVTDHHGPMNQPNVTDTGYSSAFSNTSPTPPTRQLVLSS